MRALSPASSSAMVDVQATYAVGSQPFDISWHEARLAVACVDGAVELFEHAAAAAAGEEAAEGGGAAAAGAAGASMRLVPHAESCRAVRWTRDGRRVLSAGADKALVATDVSTGAAAFRLPGAHPAGINRLITLSGEGAGNLCATGDDDGRVKLWDLRQRVAGFCFTPHVDFVADLWHEPDTQTLLCASGDGTLSRLDVRAGKVRAQSDSLQDELLSVVVLKGGTRAVAGSQEGMLHVFALDGDITEPVDRVPGHPHSVDALLKVDEDTVLTGSSDGLVRVVQVTPHKLLGVLGEHDDFPVERLALQQESGLLASASHDSMVRVWGVGELFEQDDEDADPERAPSATAGQRGAAAFAKLAAAVEGAGGDDTDSDSDSDDGGRGNKRKRKGKRKQGLGDGGGKRRSGGGGSRSNFFADL